MSADRTDEFDTALSTITTRRGAEYGHPLDDFRRVNRIKAAVADCPDAEVRHVLEMIGVKMARLCHTPDHVDSLIDIAGYARTVAMLLDERERRLEDEIPF